MRIAGIIKSSLIDYPQKASTVIFTGGCNFRCGYCHNPEILGTSGDEIKLKDLMAFLEKRKRFIDGVCITGGEPTINSRLPDFIKTIKDMGFSVKLDTNGTNPWMLEGLISSGMLDYVAMDIKGPILKYEDIVRCKVDLNSIISSANILSRAYNKGEVLCEFRTTVCKEQLSLDDLQQMLKEHESPPPWFLQQFKNPGNILDNHGTYSGYSSDDMEAMGKKLCVSVR